MKKLIALFAVVIMLSSCAVSNKERRYAQMPEYVKSQPELQQQKVNNEGSTWNNEDSLVSDGGASYEGDIVTIIVNENASSSNQSNTKLSEDSSTKSGLTTFLGAQNRVFKALNTTAGTDNLANLGGSNSYKGSGSNTKTDKLQATITARVVKVLPHHRLFIRGEKQVFTNGDEQTLIITGIIDKYKLTKDNTIDSQYISDAKIFYNGKGLVSNTHNQGWVAKLWELIRPF